MLLAHYKRDGSANLANRTVIELPEELSDLPGTSQGSQAQAPPIQSPAYSATHNATPASASRDHDNTLSLSTFNRFVGSLSEQMQNQQRLLQQMLEVLTTGVHGASRNGVPAAAAVPPPETRTVSDRAGTRQPYIGTVSPAHAVNLLAPQIPEFGGTDSKNVRLWVQRVDHIARIHRAPDDVTLLASTSRLVKIARRWFDLGSGPMIESWVGFREAVLSRFGREVIFHTAIQQIEERKWNYLKESFQEYAMKRLALMHGPNLSPKSSIRCSNPAVD